MASVILCQQKYRYGDVLEVVSARKGVHPKK